MRYPEPVNIDCLPLRSGPTIPINIVGIDTVILTNKPEGPKLELSTTEESWGLFK